MIDDLIALRQELQTDASKQISDDQFHAAMSAASRLLPFTDIEFAREIGTSRPTITRWVDGHTAPCPIMRPRVYRILLKYVEAALAGV